MSRSRGWLGFMASLVGFAVLQVPAKAQELANCPENPPATISSQMFNDVCISGTPINPIQYFDDYSWRSFLALVWPAKQGQRGQPDSSLPLDARGQRRPTVFETFKAEWEVFQPDGEEPKVWNEYGGKNPCKLADLSFGDVVLSAFSKFDSVIQPGSSGALVAQNRTYVRYSTGFNEKHFQHIRAGQFYLKKNLESFAPFLPGAIAVKAAWIDMQGIEHPERFHTRDDAWMVNLDTGECKQTKVGLVGLHIVAKTPTRPQWIWTTFEHVDNVPDSNAPGPHTFNKNDGAPMPNDLPSGAKCRYVSDKAERECPLPPPEPYNVKRVKPIYDRGHDFSTAKTNEKYRALIAQQYPNSPWKNYQLVMTQWPVVSERPDLDGSPGHTFPGTATYPYDETAFANTTMETFYQGDIKGGCMSCHDNAKTKESKKRLDFVFTLRTRAYPRETPDHFDVLRLIEVLLQLKLQ